MDNDISHAVQDQLDALSARIAELESVVGDRTPNVDMADDPDYGIDDPDRPEVAPVE